MFHGITPVHTERLRGDRTQPGDLDPWSRMLLADDFAGDDWPDELRTPEYALEVHDRDLANWQRFGFAPWSVRERESSEYVGRVGLDYTRATGRPEVQIGWLVAAEKRGRGYATEMGREGVRVAFEVLELDRVIALIAPENHVSRAVADRLGFEELGEVEHNGREHLLLAIDARER